MLGSGVLAAVLTAAAGPLQRGDVIADPVWVLHVDCDALKQTSLGKALLAELDKPEAQKKFAAMQAVFNVDPRKDLHGVTLYGATKAEPDGVVVAYADFDAARLVTLVEANKDYESTRHGAHTIHSWIDEKNKEKDGVKPRTYGAIYKGKVLIIGQKESRVPEALDVMDKSKPNLTTSTHFAKLGANGGGGFIIGAARKLDRPGNDPGATVSTVRPLAFSPGGRCISFDCVQRRISFQSLPIAVAGILGGGRFLLFGGPHAFETGPFGLLSAAHNLRFLQNILGWLLNDEGEELEAVPPGQEPELVALHSLLTEQWRDVAQIEATGRGEPIVAFVERLLRQTGVLKALARWMP